MKKSNIRILSYFKNGEITFAVNGKRYTYLMDAVHFYNGPFKSWIKHAPGKALNFAKQRGELISDSHENPKSPPRQSFFKFDDT